MYYPIMSVTANNDQEAKHRTQLSDVLSISISPARCATHFKQNLGDPDVEKDMKTLRKDLKTAKDSSEVDNSLVESLKTQITEKSKLLVRISMETPITAAVIWDATVKELLRHGMNMAAANSKKIVEVAHLHDGDCSMLVYYPLFDKCDVWNFYNPETEVALKTERAAQTKAAKDAKKKESPQTQQPQQSPQTQQPLQTVDDLGESGDEHSKTTFYTYVDNALKAVKLEEKYKAMRVSNRVRDYLSDLIVQGIVRQTALAKIVVQSVVGVRTMNADHLKAVIRMLMVDARRTPEQVDGVLVNINEKLDMYEQYQKSEREKKFASLDDDKRAELEQKQQTVLQNRKARQLEVLQKRLEKDTEKVRELQA
jgi:hypothetical protein